MPEETSRVIPGGISRVIPVQTLSVISKVNPEGILQGTM